MIRRSEIDSYLNGANVALVSGDFAVASDFANRVLSARRISKKSKLIADFLLIQVDTRQGFFTGALDLLESLFKRVPRSSNELQAKVGNEIIRVCHRSGNLGIGTQRGEEMVRDFSSKWPQAEVVELLCQLSSCHFHRGDSARAEEVVSKALLLAEESNSAKAKTQTLWQSSILTLNQGNPVLALQQVSDARHWAHLAGLRHIVPILNNNAALIMLDLPNPDLSHVHRLAESAYLEMITQNNPGGAAYASTILSEVALRREDFPIALMYARKGLIELPTEIPGPKTALLVQIAKVLTRMGDLDGAMFGLFDAVEQMEKLEPSRELARQWGDLARVFVEAGLAERGIYAYERAIQMSGLLREEEESKIN